MSSEKFNHSAIERDETWITQLKKRAERDNTVTSYTSQSTLPQKPFHWLKEIKEHLPDNAIVILDGNICMEAAQAVLKVELPVTRMTPGSNGCIGVGNPFAIGAKLASPDTPVIAICSDFALGLNIIELETVARHNIPIIVIVANNSGNGGKTRQKNFLPEDYPEDICQFQDEIHYDKIMQALGGEGLYSEQVDEVRFALQKALKNKRTTLINIITDPNFKLTKL